MTDPRYFIENPEWRNTPCPIPFHSHNGPDAECRKLIAQMEAIGPDAMQCVECHRITAYGKPCACGADYMVPKPKQPFPAAHRPLHRRESDGCGCVETTSRAERAFMEL